MVLLSQGAEFAVLQTVPWDQVDIRVLSVETHLAGRMFPGTRKDIINYMEKVGYSHLPGAHRGTNAARRELGTTDDMFVKRGVEVRDRDGAAEHREEL